MRVAGMVIKMMKEEFYELLQISVGSIATSRLITTRKICIYFLLVHTCLRGLR
jgi:hypothetical protein